MVRSVGRVALAAVALWLTVGIAGIAVAQDRRQNEPGQFDFYLLTLSWSPSFCDAVAERAAQPGRPGNENAQEEPSARPDNAADQPRRSARRNRNDQCGDRPYSFVVHGL